LLVNATMMDWLRRIFLGPDAPPRLEEAAYPQVARGVPDLSYFKHPVAHYEAYIDEYLESLEGKVADERRAARNYAEWQSHWYHKHVIGQWGLIARGPTEALPTVLRYLKHPVPEARQAASGVLSDWARKKIDVTAPALAAAEQEFASAQPDTETLGTLLTLLGESHAESALPLMARVLRDPRSSNGDLDWNAVEAIGEIARTKFVKEADPRRAADDWLRARGI
jgi:hypothetical protein